MDGLVQDLIYKARMVLTSVLQVPVGTIVKWIPDPKSLDQDELESVT